MISIEKKGKAFISFDREARELNKRFFGELDHDKVIFTPYEAIFLAENRKAKIVQRGKEIKLKELLKGLTSQEIRELIVYTDLRNKGYIARPGIKFGGNFIIYEKGKKPGVHHSKWIGIAIGKEEKIKIEEIVTKARIAHSTAKCLLICLVDGKTVLYYELRWKKI
ncbi:MAG: tRNA-intron lyase [Candidatus Pacearchaeota archaeon]